MEPSSAEKKLSEQFFETLVEATFPLQTSGPDQEVTLQALIRAADMLREHLEHELEELRLEQAE